MTDDFSSFSDDAFDDTPDWLLDDDVDTAAPAEFADTGDDEFDQLRRKSARTGSMQEEMDVEEEAASQSSGGSFSWSSFSAGQRLVLALLVVLDIIAIAFGVMVLTGNI